MRTTGMTWRLNPRHRRTVVGRTAGRAAGVYQPCDLPEPGEPPSRRHGMEAGSLAVFGLVGRARPLGFDALRSLAGSGRLSDFDARVVAMTDLLSEVRLDADADLIVWEGADGSRFATPVARLFDEGQAELHLGGPDTSARPRWSDPVILRASNIPERSGMPVVAMTAMTFAEFVGGAS